MGSQAEHKVGASTTLIVQSDFTTQCSASGSLGCEATAELGVSLADLASAALSGTLSTRLEIGASVSHTVEVGVHYTLDSDAEPGLYRIIVVFPRKTVQKRVVGVNRNGDEITLWNETVTYAPRLYDAYWSWESYELGS